MMLSIDTSVFKGKASRVYANTRAYVRRRRAFSRFVIFPTLLCAGYLFTVAADRWESESKITVKSISAMDSSASSGLSMLFGASPAVREDVMFLREFILSPDMLEYLNEVIKLREMYSKAGMDVLFRLPEDATREDELIYYRRRVSANYDDINGVLTVTTQGFSPEDAKVINQAILTRSERFLNEISQHIARDQITFLDRQIAATAERMVAARNSVIVFQRKHKLLDPVIQGEAGTRLIGKLTEEVVATEAEIRALSAFLSDKAPQVVHLKAKLGSLRTQMAMEETALTGGNAEALNAIAAQFQDLKTEADLAREVYRIGLAEMEKSKVNAIKKSKSLVVISAPFLPERSTLPNRPLWLGLFLIAALFIYGVSRLTWISVRDHKA